MVEIETGSKIPRVFQTGNSYILAVHNIELQLVQCKMYKSATNAQKLHHMGLSIFIHF